ncbi:MAG: DNA-binding protein HU [Mycoplasmataceae bacterium]|nr:MAG: DNA-binding protein HU [Mycoplasmataceae bacterium]
MNKTELIEIIATKAELTKKDAHKAVDAFLEAITSSLRDNEEVSLIGFGTFKVSHRAARKGKNPKTGEVLEIKASKVPTFKSGKSLKEAIK